MPSFSASAMFKPIGKAPRSTQFYIPAPLCETWGKFTAKSLIQWGSKNPYRCFHKSSKQAPFSPCGPRARQAAVRRPRAGPFGNSLHVQRLTLGKSPTNPAEKVTPGPHLTAPRCSTRENKCRGGGLGARGWFPGPSPAFWSYQRRKCVPIGRKVTRSAHVCVPIVARNRTIGPSWSWFWSHREAPKPAPRGPVCLTYGNTGRFGIFGQRNP